METYTVEAPLDLIDENPWQTRALDQAHAAKLAQSIEKDGLIQRPSGRIIEATGDIFDIEEFVASFDGDDFLELTEHDRRIQLAVGHHRVAAYRLLAEEEPERYGTIAIDVAAFDDEQMADLAMLENDERKDLSEIERARALQERKESFGWSNAELGRRYGMARSTVSNLLRLLTVLPPHAQQAVHDHELSGRVAGVLASAYGLPDVLQEALAESNYHGVLGPDQLLTQATEGASSKALRRALQKGIERHTASLEDTLYFNFPQDHAFDDLVDDDDTVVAPTCGECPILVKQGRGGTDKRCPSSDCRKAKTAAWRSTQLNAAAEATGLSIMPQDVGWGEKRSFYDSLQDVLAERVEDGCPRDNLVLDWRMSGTDFGPDTDEWPNVGYGCHYGDDRRCECKAQAKAEQTRNSPEKKQRKQRKHKLKKGIVEPAAETLTQELILQTPDSLLVLYYALQYNQSYQEQDWDRETILRKIAMRLVDKALPHRAADNQTKAREKVQRLLTRAGAELPWGDSEVARFEVQLSRVLLWVADLAGSRPTPEAVQGNIDNLDRLAAGLEELLEEHGRLETLTNAAERLARAQDVLEGILPVVQEWDGEDVEHVSWLVSVPADNANFTHRLDRASAGAVRYALALVRPKAADGNQTRIRTLESRLRELGVDPDEPFARETSEATEEAA